MRGRRRESGGWTGRAVAATVLMAAQAATASACGDDGAMPQFRDDAELKVVFVGNSLTYTHDLPAVFEALAAGAGLDASALGIARPDWSLEEHWRSGTAGEIRARRPDLVVLQQGPSTLSSSREHLLAWGDSMTRAVREAGAVPAYLMVWPPDDPRFSFGAVLASYRAAAEAHGAMFAPAGVAWLEAWKDDRALRLWGPDGFHPSPEGTVLAALALLHLLCGDPGPIEPPPAGVPAPLLAQLSAAAGRAVADHGFAATVGPASPGCGAAA